MKVKIGPYVDWFGPYQLAEKLCFWAKKEKDEYGIERTADWVHNFGEWLAHGSVEPEPEVGEVTSWDRERPHTFISKFLNWVHSKKKRKMEIHIDRWDTWSMDHTLAPIILPMLKQLRDTKQGCAFVDDEDVPENLRLVEREEHDQQMDLFDFPIISDPNAWTTEHRWNYVLNEMIFAFQSKVDDNWEEQFESGESDIQWKKLEGGMSQMIDGPNHTKKYDWEGRQAYQARISNGFRLFGKYYENLWD